jgi:hypothetical protein
MAIIVWQLLPKKEALPPESIQPSMAVLPFEDLSPNKDQAFLCDGFSESLINALTKIRDLRDQPEPLPSLSKAKTRAYMQPGHEAEVSKLIEELERLYEESDIGNTALYTAGAYLYVVEDKDQALQWLERAYERRDPLLIAINTWTSLDPIRQDPRFKSILAKMGL